MSRFSLKNISFSQILGIIALVLLITFVMQNLSNVSVKFIRWTFDIPIFLLIIIVFFVGFYTSIFTGSGLEKFFKKKETYEVDLKKISENANNAEK